MILYDIGCRVKLRLSGRTGRIECLGRNYLIGHDTEYIVELDEGGRLQIPQSLIQLIPAKEPGTTAADDSV